MNYSILSPYVRVGFLKGELHFGFGSLRKIIKTKALQNTLLSAAALFKKPKSTEDVEKTLEQHGHDSATVQESMEILHQNFLMPEDSYRKEDRHSRSLLYYALSGADVTSVQKKISGKHVAIVGCGGIGNVVAASLATAGVGTLTLFDADEVEVSNLNRQILFTEEDCTKAKASSLATALKERNRTLVTHEVHEFVTKENIEKLDACDFIVVSGDQLNLVEEVNEYSIQKNIPFLNIGYVEDIAVWGPFVIPGQTGCCACKQQLVNEEGLTDEQINLCREVNRNYQSPSNGPINMLASSLATIDILRFLGEFGEIQSLNQRIGLWTDTLTFEKQEYGKNPNCKVCGEIQ